MNYKPIIEKYIRQTLNGSEKMGKLARLRVERHANDLKSCYSRGLYFDEKAANHALRFFDFVHHSKGRDFSGKKFILSPWQAFDIWCIYGWKKAGGTRRFRYAYTDIARKNGKTTFAAAQAIYLMAFDKEPRAEIYTVATTRGQARICSDESREIIESSNALKEITQTTKHVATCEMTGSYIKPLSRDAKVLDGLNPHGIILDEFHAHKDDLLFKDCPKTFNVGRYHSWVIDEKTISTDIEITATDAEGLIMAARHKTFDVCGVQFHPESILSQHGETIIKNWLSV